MGKIEGENFVPDAVATTFRPRRVATVAFEDTDHGVAEDVKGAAGKVATNAFGEPSLGNGAEPVILCSKDLSLKNGDEDDTQPVEVVVFSPVPWESRPDDGQSRNLDHQSLYPRTKTTPIPHPNAFPMCGAITAHCGARIAHFGEGTPRFGKRDTRWGSGGGTVWSVS